MREIIMIKTFDGQVHRSKDEAHKYLEKLYTKRAVPLHEALAHKNATEVGVIIRDCLIGFSALWNIKKDMEYYELEDD